MKRLLFALLAVLLFCGRAQISFAQTAPDSLVYRVETKDGNAFTGTMLEQDAEKIKLKTETIGEVTIFRRDITRTTLVSTSQMRKGKLWSDNPQATRYLWSPNGYGLRKGEAYYQNVWVFFNQVAYGVTDNFSIGGGMIPLFLFAGAPTPVWITPKVSFPVSKDKVNLGVGALVGTVIGAGDDVGSAGLLYGLSTFGSRDRNFTVGLGYGFAGGEMASTPVVTASGMLRIGAKGYLLTENYLIRSGGESFGLFMIGGRYIIQKVGLDFGLVIPSGVDETLAIPWLGLTIPFGRSSSDQIR
jgi:hypothetical protein